MSDQIYKPGDKVLVQIDGREFEAYFLGAKENAIDNICLDKLTILIDRECRDGAFRSFNFDPLNDFYLKFYKTAVKNYQDLKFGRLKLYAFNISPNKILRKIGSRQEELKEKEMFLPKPAANINHLSNHDVISPTPLPLEEVKVYKEKSSDQSEVKHLIKFKVGNKEVEGWKLTSNKSTGGNYDYVYLTEGSVLKLKNGNFAAPNTIQFYKDSTSSDIIEMRAQATKLGLSFTTNNIWSCGNSTSENFISEIDYPLNATLDPDNEKYLVKFTTAGKIELEGWLVCSDGKNRQIVYLTDEAKKKQLGHHLNQVIYNDQVIMEEIKRQSKRLGLDQTSNQYWSFGNKSYIKNITAFPIHADTKTLIKFNCLDKEIEGWKIWGDNGTTAIYLSDQSIKKIDGFTIDKFGATEEIKASIKREGQRLNLDLSSPRLLFISNQKMISIEYKTQDPIEWTLITFDYMGMVVEGWLLSFDIYHTNNCVYLTDESMSKFKGRNFAANSIKGIDLNSERSAKKLGLDLNKDQFWSTPKEKIIKSEIVKISSFPISGSQEVEARNLIEKFRKISIENSLEIKTVKYNHPRINDPIQQTSYGTFGTLSDKEKEKISSEALKGVKKYKQMNDDNNTTINSIVKADISIKNLKSGDKVRLKLGSIGIEVDAYYLVEGGTAFYLNLDKNIFPIGVFHISNSALQKLSLTDNGQGYYFNSDKDIIIQKITTRDQELEDIKNSKKKEAIENHPMNTLTNNQESSKEKTFTQKLKEDMEEAAYRLSAAEFTSAMKSAVLLLFKDKGMKDEKLSLLKELLEDEMGDAIISAILGYGLAYAPIEQFKNDPRVLKIAKEFRVAGLTTTGSKILGVAKEYFLPALMTAYEKLPPISTVLPEKMQATKRRVASTDLQTRLPELNEEDNSVDVEMELNQQIA